MTVETIDDEGSDTSGSSDTSGIEDEFTETGARTARRFGPVALVASVVVALLVGLAAGLLVPQLTRPGDDSAEAGFARDMTTHHAQAVEMGFLAFSKGTDPGVRTLGADIASSQQGDIGTMQTWLRSWHLDPTGSQPRMAWMPDGGGTVRDGLMPGMATKAEMDQLRAITGRDFDLLFLRLMINHHLGGIHMVDAIIDAGGEADVIRAANTMKSTQQGELNYMQELQKTIEAAAP